MAGKDKKLSYQQRAGLSYVEQEEPAFITEMKKKAGYKAPAKLEDKFDDGEDDIPETTEGELLRTKEEDRPQVVVLDPTTDLTADELKKALGEEQRKEDEKKIAEGKITFKKPVKRGADGKEAAETAEEKKARLDKAKQPTPTLQKSLLSFGDDEEE